MRPPKISKRAADRWAARERDAEERKLSDRPKRKRPVRDKIIESAPMWNGRPCWLITASGYAGVPDDAPCPVCTAPKAVHYAVAAEAGNVTLVCPAPEDVERMKNVMLAAKKSAMSDSDVVRLLKQTDITGLTAQNLLLSSLKEKALQVAGTPFVVPRGKPSAEYLVSSWLGPDSLDAVRVALNVDLRLLSGGIFSDVGSTEIARLRVTDRLSSVNSFLNDIGSLRLDPDNGFVFRPAVAGSSTLTDAMVRRATGCVSEVCLRLQNAADMELQKAGLALPLTPEMLGDRLVALKRLRADVLRNRASELRGASMEYFYLDELKEDEADKVQAQQATRELRDENRRYGMNYLDSPNGFDRLKALGDEQNKRRQALNEIGAYMPGSITGGSGMSAAPRAPAKPTPAAPPVVQPKKRGFNFDE